jgi:hypothetical protein
MFGIHVGTHYIIGGECDLSNYQTLCTNCHEGKTVEQKVHVKLQNASKGVADIRSFFAKK